MLDTTHRAIVGDAFEVEVTERFPLVICDCPYGRILKKTWDVAAYDRWMGLCASRSLPESWRRSPDRFQPSG